MRAGRPREYPTRPLCPDLLTDQVLGGISFVGTYWVLTLVWTVYILYFLRKRRVKK